MPSRQQKRRAKQRERYLQNREQILTEEGRARARARYRENPEKQRAAVRKRYHDTIKKKRASKMQQWYHDNPEPKLSAKREGGREEHRVGDVRVCMSESVCVCVCVCVYECVCMCVGVHVCVCVHFKIDWLTLQVCRTAERERGREGERKNSDRCALVSVYR